MKESLIADLKNDFVRKNRDIDMDYQSAGAGSLMAKIAAEGQSGRIMADIIWTSEVPDFYKMKGDGILIKYRPKGVEQTLNPLVGTDDYFSPARLGTLGIVYNTKQIKKAPVAWKDLLAKEYNRAFSIADPSLSGTSFVSVAMLKEAFGDQFFVDLRKNGPSSAKVRGRLLTIQLPANWLHVWAWIILHLIRLPKARLWQWPIPRKSCSSPVLLLFSRTPRLSRQPSVLLTI